MTNMIEIDICRTATSDYCLDSSCQMGMDPTPSQDLDVLGILDVVGHVINGHDFSGIDPTPIGPEGVKVVDEVQLTDLSFLNDLAMTDCLSRLLTKSLGENSKQTETLSSFDGNKMHLAVGRYNACNSPTNGTSSVISCTSCSEGSGSSPLHIRAHQSEQWNIRYSELVEYQRTYGHCLVPNYWAENPRLALWVKRQRYQHKLKNEGSHSTMKDEREEKLERLGFVWDSHRAMWEERLNELREFKDLHGHCNVPASYPENRQLAIWVKCQRRQYRLYCEGKRSHMTPERIRKLIDHGFVWNPRKQKGSEQDLLQVSHKIFC